MRPASRIPPLLLLSSVVLLGSIGPVGCAGHQLPQVVPFHPPETHTVTISGRAPDLDYPETVRVQRGDTLQWTIDFDHEGWEIDLGPNSPAYDRWLRGDPQTSTLRTVIRLGVDADRYKYAFSLVFGESIYIVDPIIIVEDD